MKKLIVFVATLTLMLSGVTAWAGAVTIPNVFTPNTPAKADSVNENFSAIDVAVDNNAAMISSLQNAHSGTRTGYFSVSAAGFNPLTTTGYSFDRDFSNEIKPLNTSSVIYQAAVSLPNGATIISFSSLCDDRDSASGNNCFTQLRSQCRAPYLNDIEATAGPSSTYSSTTAVWMPQIYNKGSIVDNTNCFYFVRAYITSTGNIHFYGSRIGYEYTLD